MKKKYQIIYADPPWKFEVWNRDTGLGRSAESHYPTMNFNDLLSFPIDDIADKDCALFLWSTPPLLSEAIALIEGWGFEYKTKAFCWVKTTMRGLHWGMGYWTRANTEDCLLATRGNPRRIDKGIHQVIMSDVLDHSHKPAIVRERIVQLMGDLPRIELFARQRVAGWDCWGNEVESDINLDIKGGEKQWQI